MDETAVKNINWEDQQTHIFLNPRWPSEEVKHLTDLAQSLKLSSHIWIASSGSQNKKLIALSKKAFLVSGQAVNKHLEAHSKDKWVNALPSFHVGGLSIYARATLTQSSVVHLNNWSPHAYVQLLEKEKATLSALVPTQVYDLVHVQFRAPKTVRAVIVGGAQLPPALYQQARRLEWPLLPSFGMTECCSQIATASLGSLTTLDSPNLQILDHCQLKADADKILSVHSAALMSGFFEIDSQNPKWQELPAGAWFQTEDYVEIQGSNLKSLGRRSDFVKIGGEAVSLLRLREILEKITPPAWRGQLALAAEVSPRLGHELVLFSTPNVDAPCIQRYFDLKVAPYEKIRQIKVVPEIPKSALGKIIYQNLK